MSGDTSVNLSQGSLYQEVVFTCVYLVLSKILFVGLLIWSQILRCQQRMYWSRRLLGKNHLLWHLASCSVIWLGIFDGCCCCCCCCCVLLLLLLLLWWWWWWWWWRWLVVCGLWLLLLGGGGDGRWLVFVVGGGCNRSFWFPLVIYACLPIRTIAHCYIQEFERRNNFLLKFI